MTDKDESGKEVNGSHDYVWDPKMWTMGGKSAKIP